MEANQFLNLRQDYRFLNNLNNTLGNAVCVVNKDIAIVYYNSEFTEMFGEPGKDLLGERFGASIGCKGHEQMYPGGICNNCKLRLSMLATIMLEADQEKQSIVLQMEAGKKEELRLIQFKSNYMEYAGEKFAVVLMNDLTDMGNETLKFINDFYEDKV